jgi:hypothetical protein
MVFASSSILDTDLLIYYFDGVEKGKKLKILRYIGIALFALSFVVPSVWGARGDFRLFGGAQAFIETPIMAFKGLATNPNTSHDPQYHLVFFFLLMMGAWIANLTIFVRVPRPLAVIAILLPWPAYICFFPDLTGFLPFYPWAVGIALIHISRWPKPVYAQPKTAP